MLVQLLPDQVSRYWDVLSGAIEGAVPPTVKRRPDMNKVLQSLLCGQLVAWVLVGEDKKITAIVTSIVVEEPCSGIKNLLIYSLFGTGDLIGRRGWRDGLQTLIAYGRGKGCEQLIAFSRDAGVVKVMQMLGADVGTTLIAIPI